MLEVQGLHASIEDKEILKGIDISVPKGKIVAVMGPNGSGKSTLSNVIMGSPLFEVTAGSVLFEGEDVLEMDPHERSLAGIFMSFQYPTAIPGVTVNNFLKAAVEAHRGKMDVRAFLKEMRDAMDTLGIPHDFARRYLNVGFSGGEKKRLEMLQMLLLRPKLAILDETDSGLDIDALRIVSDAVNSMRDPDRSFLIITHYSRILNLIEPDIVNILIDGKLAHTGGRELADRLEDEGYEWLKSQT